MSTTRIDTAPSTPSDVAVLGTPQARPGTALALDAMAAICVDAGRLAATGHPRSPMLSKAYYDALVHLPPGAPALAVASRLFADCYDAALAPDDHGTG